MTSAPRSLKKVIASAIGQFVEFYDFVIYAYSATVIAKLFFPESNPVNAVLLTFTVYAVGFAIGPIGGIFFGILGDRIGRRSVLVVVILMMGGGTMAIGFLPTYATAGILAPILLVICRLVQGFSAAGETMTSNAFVAEHAPPEKRGLYVAFTYSFTTLPSVVAAIFVWLLISGMGDDLYEAWGWRIPFLIGGPMALIGMYIRSKISESPVFEAAKADHEVVVEQHIPDNKGSNLKPVIQTLTLAAVGALGFYTLSGYMVAYLTTMVELPQNQALVTNGIALFVAFMSFWAGGALSDRYGRRPVLTAMLITIIVTYIPSFWLAAQGTVAGALSGQLVFGVVFGMFYGVYGVTIMESFATRNRLKGTMICFNLSYTVFGGTAPLVSTWLITLTGSLIAPGVYMVVLAVIALGVFVALKMPETVGSSLLHAEDRVAAGRP